MATGYGSSYRGVVVDNADPDSQDRVAVMVPEVYGDQSTAWARPCVPPGSVQLPAVGDDVTITFEQGDSDYPVWQAFAGSTGPDGDADAEQGSRRFEGMYQATVVDNVDPDDAHRLQVLVPEVLSDEPSWARPSSSMSDADLPDVGTDVWIEFEQGDPNHPIWVGTT